MAAICAAAPLALANQLPLPTIVQRGWSWHCRGRGIDGIAAVSSAIEESDLYLYLAVGCHYFPPGVRYLPSRRASPPLGRYQVILLGNRCT